MREESSQAPHADLDFIEDQEGAALRAELARRGQELARRRHHAALALHRLDDERCRVVVDGFVERRNVVERGERKPARERLEAFLILRCVGGRECAEGTAVERAVGREDRRPFAFVFAPGELPGKLDCRLVRFGAGIAEEDRIEAGERGELVGERPGRLVVVEVASVHERRGLFRDRARDPRVRVSQRAHGEARDHIEIAVPRLVEEIDALTADEVHLLPGVVHHQVRVARDDPRAFALNRDAAHGITSGNGR